MHKYPNQISIIRENFDELRKRSLITTFDIHDWFEAHINVTNNAAFGYPGKVLGRNGSHDTVFIVRDGSLWCDMTISWQYSDSSASIAPPDLELLNDILDDITVSKIQVEDEDFALTGLVTFNLSKWQGFIVPYINDRLAIDIAGENTSPSRSRNAKREVCLLLQYFYPSVKYETLVMAAELGIAQDDAEVFASWFDSHVNGLNISAIALPEDITAFENNKVL